MLLSPEYLKQLIHKERTENIKITDKIKHRTFPQPNQ